LCDSYITIFCWNLQRWRCQTIERQRWRETVMVLLGGDVTVVFHGVVWGLSFTIGGLRTIDRTIEKNCRLGLVERRFDWEEPWVGFGGTVRKGNDRRRPAGMIAREEKGKGFTWKRKGTVLREREREQWISAGTIAREEKGKGFMWKRKGTVDTRTYFSVNLF